MDVLLVLIKKNIEMNAYTLNLNSVIQINDPQFEQICRNNPEIKFEISAKGQLKSIEQIIFKYVS